MENPSPAATAASPARNRRCLSRIRWTDATPDAPNGAATYTCACGFSEARPLKSDSYGAFREAAEAIHLAHRPDQRGIYTAMGNATTEVVV